MSTNNIQKANISLRNFQRKDLDQVHALSIGIYGSDYGFSKQMLAAHINKFPEGQFLVLDGEKVIGHCATFIVNGDIAFKDHTYEEITGGGFASRHNPEGEYLYGMEVTVDPEYRGMRIGQRLYDARKQLCTQLGLKGIVFGGRMPNFAKRKKQVGTPEKYVEMALDKQIKDHVIGFQIRNGFNFIKVLRNYSPLDLESGGNACLMVWENPLYDETQPRHSLSPSLLKSNVRVCSVQFQMRKVNSFEEFINQVAYFVDVASDYRSDFVCFPEFLTMPLISLSEDQSSSSENIEYLTTLTEQFIEAMSEMAVSYNINIIGGTHPTRVENNEIHNMAYVFLRDGAVHTQPKIHITPSEKYWRNIHGGNSLTAIETDCGTIGVNVCYDSEFPELARNLTDQGINILFVPFCTDDRQGYNRVRYCSAARAIENQIYVVMAGTVGNLPNITNMDINYAESCILTPCDFPFARDGIAATSAPNTEMVVMSDLNIETLVASRKSGTVQNLRDRRLDLYQVKWKNKSAE
ncbi:GNAT family N-acetyltransferase [Hirschia litorea]|uniref:GNAT family N-acetyltransferase n=1 Tax=Hirschia litorea TaxID=1199156 RepID=A0ABW2IL25_9PROT